MIVFEKFGHKVELSNEHWKNIRRRFNPDRAMRRTLGIYSIELECSLCKKYKKGWHCRGNCPFERFEDNKYGCTEFIHKIIGPVLEFGIGTDELSWSETNDERVRLQLKTLNRFMDEIEIENGGLT